MLLMVVGVQCTASSESLNALNCVVVFAHMNKENNFGFQPITNGLESLRVSDDSKFITDNKSRI